jgi:hypothetical protein
MKLCTPDGMPGMIPGRICRQSRFVSVVGAAVMAAMMTGFPLFLLWQAELSRWTFGLALCLAGAVVMLLGRWAVRSLSSENWLLRIASDGLWINLRSYLNRDFATAETVLFVPYAEIASVGEHSVKRGERTNGRTTTWTDRYLDIRLAAPALAELKAEIAEERRRVAEGVHLGGLVTSRTRHNHVPVTIPADDLLRISWRGRQDFVVPSLKKVLPELSAQCNLNGAGSEEVTNFAKLSSEAVDRLILERVENGDTFGAVKLLRDERGYSLKESKEFVEELLVRL